MSAAPELTLTAPNEGAWSLIRSNSAFTRVWLAQLVSFAGDWIASVALLSVLLDLTGHGIMVSLLILCNTLSQFVLTPLAGVIADRWDRQKIMVGADAIRAVLVMGYLLVHSAQQIWLLYLITVICALLGACFAPASSAALPNLVTRRQLVAANALSSAAWGTMLAVGAALGGLISAYLGRDAAYIADALTFVFSAAMVASVRQPFSGVHETASNESEPDKSDANETGANNESQPSDESDRGPDPAALLEAPLPEAAPDAPSADPQPGAWQRTGRDFAEALRYAVQHRTVLALLLLKTVWGIGGGVIALLSVYPVQVLHAGDAGVGTMYTARGVGALLGPLMAQWVCGNQARAMVRTAAMGLLICGAFYMLFAVSPTLWVGAAMICLAHLGGGILWVLSTTLLQRITSDRVLGRISSLDMGGITLTMSVSTLLCGWGLETIGPRAVGIAAGASLVICGVAWMVAYLWWWPLSLGRTGGHTED